MKKKASSSPKAAPSKNGKLYEHLTKTITDYILGKNYIPMKESTLFETLRIPKNQHATCKKIITDLLGSDVITVNKKLLQPPPKRQETMTGTIHLHPKGFGFVEPDDSVTFPQDVFIPKHLIANAVDGDKVEVAINTAQRSEKGPDGKVVDILERGRTHVAGIILKIDPSGQMIIHVPLLGSTKPVLIPAGSKKIGKKKNQVGDRITVKILDWSPKNSMILGEITEYLGHISDPSCDTLAAIKEYALPEEFPEDAIEEAKSFGSKIKSSDLAKRIDLTETTSFTIDPETAKDFDDALSISKDPQGNYHLGVHIADVAHYIPADSALDRLASVRCNSTYLPDKCIPMLPEELSNHLCSLKPKVIRLTVSVLMHFDSKGTLKSHSIARTYIKSAKRFTYEEAMAIIDGKAKSPFSDDIHLMVELCHLLRAKRSARGSIDFSLPDTVIELNKEGEPTGIRVVPYDLSHQLVEEFMLKANEIVAVHLELENKPLLFRIHEKPSEENSLDFFALARSLGFPLPQSPTTKDIQNLFDEAKKTPFGQQLSVGFIRMMKMAYYSPNNVGHYGLALEHYCHFTSPIRRYTDIIIQRLLFDEQKEVEYLDKIANNCSSQERISMKAENSLKQLKKLRLLQKYYNEDPSRKYQVAITRIKPYGISFEIPSLLLEGFLHISELENDYFVYDGQRNILTGKHTGIIHKVGQPLEVVLDSVDFILLESKWQLAGTKKKEKRSR